MKNTKLDFELVSFKDLQAYIKVFGGLGKNRRIDATNEEWERAKKMRIRLISAFEIINTIKESFFNY